MKMYACAANAKFTYDDFAAAVAFVESSGPKLVSNVPDFRASEILKKKDGVHGNVNTELVTLLEGCVLQSKHMLLSGALRPADITKSAGTVFIAGPGNETKVETGWWGIDVYFNNTFASVIGNALALGSGTAALAAAIGGMLGAVPVAVVMAIVSALLAIGSALVFLANSQGRGIYLRISYIPPFFWIDSQ